MLPMLPLLLLPLVQEPHFPPSTPLAEGISPEAVAALDQRVRDLVDEGEIVGAEVLLLKNGRTIHHEAYGLADKASEQPMKTGSVFCIRSMTKSITGTAVLMLVDDGELELDDPVAKYLEEYDREGKRGVTIEHLLTHTSGLPLSLLLGKDLRALENVRDVAALGADYELPFTPGEDFEYSDQGSDTLTAIVEVVTGAPAHEFVDARILGPLGMDSTRCWLEPESPLLPRCIPKYAGSRGSWQPFWTPADEPIFPFFLGSQSCYSTLEDYGRFLELWQNKGRLGRERLLANRIAKKALKPNRFGMNFPTGFQGLTPTYGMQMQLWVNEDGEVRAFGHGGSDGTFAWMFPEEKAMAFYFTQSRGNVTGVLFEEALAEVFLGVPFNPAKLAPPLDPFVGFYREDEKDRHRAIIRQGDTLAIEVLGKAVVPLDFMGDDRWRPRADPSKVLEFFRDEDGEVTGYRIGEHAEYRFDPADDELPPLEDIIARVTETHGLAALEQLGPLTMKGTISIPRFEMEGSIESIHSWPNRYRFTSVVSGESERSAYDGAVVSYSNSTNSAAALEGLEADTVRRENLFARFGDWRDWYPDLQVVQHIVKDDQDALLIRSGGLDGPGTTLYVDWKSGRLARVDRMASLVGAGTLGQSLEFGDYREIEGMLLPFAMRSTIMNPTLGGIDIEVRFEESSFGAEVTPETFRIVD